LRSSIKVKPIIRVPSIEDPSTMGNKVPESIIALDLVTLRCVCRDVTNESQM